VPPQPNGGDFEGGSFTTHEADDTHAVHDFELGVRHSVLPARERAVA
jgi:hypothetical protein